MAYLSVVLLIALSFCVINSSFGRERCKDDRRFKTKFMATLDCRQMAKAKPRSILKKHCKHTVYGCCHSCYAIGVRGNRNCSDALDYETMETVVVKCSEYLELFPQKLKKECQANSETKAKCCSSCQKAADIEPSTPDNTCIKEVGGHPFYAGGMFSDEKKFQAYGDVKEILISNGSSSIKCFGLVYGEDTFANSVCHGSRPMKNTATKIELREGEKITGISGSVNNIMTGLRIKTNMGTLGPFGRIYGQEFDYTIDGRMKLAYISGWTNAYYMIDLTLHFLC